MMKFAPASLFLFFIMMLSTLVSALPVNMQVGTKQNVTWDTSDAPTQITNPIGRIILSKGGLLDLDNPLADGFDILLGEFEVTVPDVEPADDYAIVLFGDSGNASPQFTIEA
ncbi:unnamed protein product [Somion occarium]|uniref:Uncharacterized protein n=1 Tax=Somion occarium TaxID=3059160 RepID=A0ABP1DZZ8_9APHY